jgi:hypothetical protein
LRVVQGQVYSLAPCGDDGSNGEVVSIDVGEETRDACGLKSIGEDVVLALLLEAMFVVIGDILLMLVLLRVLL